MFEVIGIVYVVPGVGRSSHRTNSRSCIPRGHDDRHVVERAASPPASATPSPKSLQAYALGPSLETFGGKGLECCRRRCLQGLSRRRDSSAARKQRNQGATGRCACRLHGPSPGTTETMEYFETEQPFR